MDPEKLIMKGSAQALALEADRIAGVSTRESLTSADVGMALAGMKAEKFIDRDGKLRHRYSPEQVKQVDAALYHVLGNRHARDTLGQRLGQMLERGQRNGRLPKQACVPQYPDLLAFLAVIAPPALDQLLAGGDADAWRRELAPIYREVRSAISSWTSIGLGHVRRRSSEEEDE